jgi:DnaJ homolog subfamily C member 14
MEFYMPSVLLIYTFATLFIQVIAASAVAFIGLGFAILLVSVLGVVILWFYGSFWTTSSVIVLGGHIR